MVHVDLQFQQAHILPDRKELILYGAIANLDGTKVIRSKIKGSIKDAIKLGKELGNKIKAQTNSDFLFK